jgi:hypothetical protein
LNFKWLNHLLLLTQLLKLSQNNVWLDQEVFATSQLHLIQAKDLLEHLKV